MKAITLWQPWASLIAYGIKTRETRSRRPPRQLIASEDTELGRIHERFAIHAAKRPLTRDELESPILRALPPEVLTLPLGAVVATALITRVDEADGTQLDPYGDYGAGRFFWTLEAVQRFDEPVPAIGHQGWWDWLPELCPVHRDHSGGDYCGAW